MTSDSQSQKGVYVASAGGCSACKTPEGDVAVIEYHLAGVTTLPKFDGLF